jgi:hypothetical protein
MQDLTIDFLTYTSFLYGMYFDNINVLISGTPPYQIFILKSGKYTKLMKVDLKGLPWIFNPFTISLQKSN